MIKNICLSSVSFNSKKTYFYSRGFLIINNEISITKYGNTHYVIVFVDINDNNNNYS